MKVYFLEKSIPFTSLDLNSHKLGGTEKTLINITNELAKNKNLDVKVFNEFESRKVINNVEWLNLKNYNTQIVPEVLIAFSDIGLFKKGADQTAATGFFVHVNVTRCGYRPAPISARDRVAFAPFIIDN